MWPATWTFLEPFILSLCLVISVINIDAVKISIEFDNKVTEISSRTSAPLHKVFLLVCSANDQPTEWVANFDDTRTDQSIPARRGEWSTRTNRSRNYDEWEYKAWLWLRFDRFQFQKFIACRSVSNHSDYLLVSLEPQLPNEIRVAVGPSFSDNTSVAPLQQIEPSLNVHETCKVRFTVAQVDGEYYWRCDVKQQLQEQPAMTTTGSIRFHNCTSSAYCANTFRATRVHPKCITVVSRISLADKEAWYKNVPTDYRASVAVCKNEVDETVGSTEYFLTRERKSQGSRTLHFSLSEVDSSDLIWLDPTPNSIYYTCETLDTSCFAEVYGLAKNPKFLRFYSNESNILVQQELQPNRTDSGYLYIQQLRVKLQQVEPGTYVIQCSAPMWNSIEFVNHTVSIQVHTAVPPYFESHYANITFVEGEINQELECDVTGDPPPVVNWTHNFPGARADHRRLVIPRISAEWGLEHEIRCEGTNKFGDSESKLFHVKIDPVSSSSTTTVIIVVIVLIVLLLLGSLVLVAVRATRNVVRVGRQIARILSDDEVNEFIKGRLRTLRTSTHSLAADATESDEDDLSESERVEQLAIEFLPYNQEFEVARENLFFDVNSKLGSGQFGVVYKGRLNQRAEGFDPIPVAVKTILPNAPEEYFKALLSELKILAHIGPHENIVTLIGAYTANIRNMELYILLELCKTSLLKHLQQFKTVASEYANAFVIDTHVQTRTTTGSSSETRRYTLLSSCESGFSRIRLEFIALIRWCFQIATGMEFLSRNGVVHADLAARNVLLSDDMQAKIGDFGLSRRLVNNTYIKKTECPLPLKWMAIEALTKREFTTKSDVWAYGVTLWEIFSLGTVPYLGTKFDLDFVNQLVSGTRLSKPKYATDGIYNMMVKCWSTDKKDRPTFKNLEQFFMKELDKRTRYQTVSDFNEL